VCTLLLGFDAFSDHLHPQVPCKVHDCPHDLGGPVTLSYPADE
jgi:hypothetical protein